MGFYEAHLEGKTLAPLLAMRSSKSFKPGPPSVSRHQSRLTPLLHPPLFRSSPFSVSLRVLAALPHLCSSLDVLHTQLSSPSGCCLPSARPPVSPSLGLSCSVSLPPGGVAAGAGAQRALLPAAASTLRNHLWEARLLDGFDGFSQAGMSHAGDHHQHSELKGFVT